MTVEQFNMIIELLAKHHKVELKSFSLEINLRLNNIYELDLFMDGGKTVLKLGTFEECLEMAKEYLNIRYFI